MNTIAVSPTSTEGHHVSGAWFAHHGDLYCAAHAPAGAIALDDHEVDVAVRSFTDVGLEACEVCADL